MQRSTAPRCFHPVSLVVTTFSVRGYADRRDEMVPELYQLLDVHANASPQEIKVGFLIQVKRLHPDVNHAPDASDKFGLVKQAYNTLSDMETRRQYDSTTVGIQDDWIYGDEENDVAMPTDEEGMTTMLYEIESKIQRVVPELADSELVGSMADGLKADLATLRARRQEIRTMRCGRPPVVLFPLPHGGRCISAPRTKLRQAEMKKGGSRAKARKRRFSASSAWWDVPDNPTHRERMHGGGRRNRPVQWDPYLRGMEATIPERK
jgi:curved DNA-binding protein CbpA